MTGTGEGKKEKRDYEWRRLGAGVGHHRKIMA
jgi:hypothetical protein